MNPSTDLSLAELEARAAALEQELDALHSVIAARRAQAMYTLPTQPTSVPSPRTPSFSSNAAPTGPAAAPPPIPGAEPAQPSASAPLSSSVRLCGYLKDGKLWNIAIPFNALSRPDGVTIGRVEDCADIPLDDESVSRCHARLMLTQQALTVCDMGSTNGTYINSTPVPYGAPPQPLLDADTLTLGSINLRVDLIF